ncbi:MAG: hypothetical protein J0M34_06720 [Alphaproteobacteria bacterium]|nr:hypothetical protein [Alphaproteobacteria bacterium]
MKRNQRGLSLVIVAVLLVVIGVAAGTVLMRKDTEAVWNPRTGSHTNLERIQQALIDYQRTNHRLPCVAPRNVLPSAVGYAEELANCAAGAAATGGTVRLDIGGGVHIRIGTIPTKTLGLTESAGEDEWKNRILYAVSEALTDPYQFTTASGVIRVNDAAGAAKLTNAAFVIVSHGADGKGGYGAKAASVGKVCAATQGVDQANCNDTDAVFVDTTMETSAGANFFDDIIAWSRVDEVAQSMNRPCVAGTIGNATWGTGCSNNSWSNMLSGTGGQNVSNTNTSTHVGNATLACDNGALVYSGESCFRHCTASAQSWSGGNCAGNVPLVNHTASSGTITNTNPGYSGDAEFSCTDGVLSITSSNCSVAAPPPPGDCAAQAVNWNTDCTGNAPLLANGANTSVNNAAPGYTGSVTVTCNAGVLSQSGASCSAASDPCFDAGMGTGCLMTGPFYGTGCIGTDIGGGVCCSGCTSSCASDTRTWTVGAHTCTATVPVTSSGSNGIANDTVGPKQGSASFSCSAGTLAASPNPGATCAPFVPPCLSPNCSTTHPNTGNPLCIGDDTSRTFASTCSEYICCSGVLTVSNLSPACPGMDAIDSGVCSGSPCAPTECLFTDGQNCASTCIANGNYKTDIYMADKPRYQCSGGSMNFIDMTQFGYVPPPACP